MKKRTKQSFLFRNRFVIGYAILIIAFVYLLATLPGIAPHGLNRGEMESVVTASQIDNDFIASGKVVNLPYLIVQKASIGLFGLSLYSIKLPSVIFAILGAFFIVLLLNRWFKSDVAIIGSIFTTLSTAFLFLAGNGTPAIMYVFWLALILWLGSKIVGNRHVRPVLVACFMSAIALSIYTPHMFYVALAIAVAGLIHPHLRFALKQLKIYQIVIIVAIMAALLAPLVVSCIAEHNVIRELLFTDDFSLQAVINNSATAFAPFFSFGMAYDSIYLAPLFGLATVAMILIGTLASIGKLFTSRNTVVSLLIIFAIIFSGLNQSIAISVIVPIAILNAAGIESIIGKWHKLFPENPYAHIVGALPIIVVVGIILASDLSHFIYGYRYAPHVADNFSNDISYITDSLDSGSVLVVDPETEYYDFYKLLENYNSITVTDKTPDRKDLTIAYLGKTTDDEKLELTRIITSPKSRNSDRLYIYKSATKEKTGENTDEPNDGPDENAESGTQAPEGT
ncbi:glycosyltransferase family 39 protein [Candidatus Saccharibacteria bacterium]|nr:glycosyltransferase family 39 protein [Candidatus Saccharibacteria bacterium]